MRNGAEILLAALEDEGIELCLSNPGTSEMHLVEALAKTSIRSVLGLFEGVCTGAADGYARMTGRPALTLLHLGPGLANGLSHIHNARRGQVPMLTLVGDHARPLLPLDPPLSSDIAAIAQGVGAHYISLDDPDTIERSAREAVATARTSPGRPVVLVLPADCAWTVAAEAVAFHPGVAETVDLAAIRQAAAGLRAAGPRGAVLIGQPMDDATLDALAEIATAYGTRLLCETFAARHPRGAGRILMERMAYFPRDVLMQLAQTDYLLLAGSKRPTAFFAYPGAPLDLVPETTRVDTLCQWGLPLQPALAALAADAVRSAPAFPSPPALTRETSAAADRPLDSASLAATVAHWLPEDAIVVDESITNFPFLYAATARAARHDWLSLPGGALGYSMPAAIGAALACPGRRVVCIVGDGAAHYSVQAIWTMARQMLPITIIVLANEAYRILEMEFAAMTGASPEQASTQQLTRLAGPRVDWPSIARGYGADSVTAGTTGELMRALEGSAASSGPFLIEARLP